MAMKEKFQYDESKLREKLFEIVYKRISNINEHLEFILAEYRPDQIVEILSKRNDFDQMVLEFFHNYPNEAFIMKTMYAYRPMPGAFQWLLSLFVSSMCKGATPEKISKMAECLNQESVYQLAYKYKHHAFTVCQILYGLFAVADFEENPKLVHRIARAGYRYQQDNLEDVLGWLGVEYYMENKEGIQKSLRKLGISYMLRKG